MKFTTADLRRTEGRRSRAADTEHRILQAARGLLATSGPEACSMRAVAERSGVTPGAIYRHFEGKQALLERVVDAAFEQFEASLLESIVSLPVGSFARLAALGEAYIRFAVDHEEEFKVLFMPQSGPRRVLGELPGQAGYAILRRCAAEAIASGELAPVDPDLAALHLWTRVHGIVTLHLACDLGGEPGLEAAADPAALFAATRSLVLDGLGRGGSSDG